MHHSEYNAHVEIIRNHREARVIRVYPKTPKTHYLPGQYGSLGLASELTPEKLIKRAYSISSSIVDLSTKNLINQQSTDYYEFYFNRITENLKTREALTPKLFALKSGDAIFCGQKIVGYYTVTNLPAHHNILLIGSGTGEAPNNSIINHLLRQNGPAKICQIVHASEQWESLYSEEHRFLTHQYPNYRYNIDRNTDHRALCAQILRCLDDPAYSEDLIGFELNPESCHVFLCGDPKMIGAPQKQGAWNTTIPEDGLIAILLKKNFTIRTKFKEGTIEYETYW